MAVFQLSAESDMILSQAVSKSGPLTGQAIRKTLSEGLAGKFTGRKVLVLIPDHTRSLPLPELFRIVVDHVRPCRTGARFVPLTGDRCAVDLEAASECLR